MRLGRFVRIGALNIGYFDHNSADDLAVTGVGFRPTLVVLFARSSGGTYGIGSWGVDDKAHHRCLYTVGDSVAFTDVGNYSIFIEKDASNYIIGKLKSFDSDGFTIDWSLTGTCTAYVIWLAMR